MKDKHSSEEEMSSEELNDKLNDLWTGSKNRDKRKKWLKNLTPSHSRRSDQSELNTSSQLQQEQQLLRIRDKLAY